MALSNDLEFSYLLLRRQIREGLFAHKYPTPLFFLDLFLESHSTLATGHEREYLDTCLVIYVKNSNLRLETLEQDNITSTSWNEIILLIRTIGTMKTTIYLPTYYGVSIQC